MTRKQAESKAREVASAIMANADAAYERRIEWSEFSRNARALWDSVCPEGGPICGRRYAIFDRVVNLVNGRDINYGF